MNNEIGRKLTSLTLLSILLVSGVTFGVPGAIPTAEASHNANLFVSAENSQFNNYFAGPQVIEVVINDNDIRSLDDAVGEPDVTVNGKKLRMAQATDGNWYGYFADRVQAVTADSTQDAGTAGGGGLDFGKFCDNNDGDVLTTTGTSISVSDTVGFAIPRVTTVGGGTDSALPDIPATTAIADCTGTDPGTAGLTMHVIRENKTLNKAYPGVTAQDGGQINIALQAWPFIQLYDFSMGGNVVIKYNKGGGVQTTTLTFDTIPSNLIYLEGERPNYPQGAQVHVRMIDPQLNIDPTDEDSWTWGAAKTNNTLFYQLFDENGNIDADGTDNAQNIMGNLTSLMFEKNGRLIMDPTPQGVSVARLQDNGNSVMVDGRTASLSAASIPHTFREILPNGGVFAYYDENDISSTVILDDAPRGKSFLATYNDVTYSLVVGFGFGTLTMAAPDGEWNSGEEIPVTLVDPDANKNSRADEDLDLNSNSTSLIPTLRIGDPFTLATANDAALYASVRVGVGSTAAEHTIQDGWAQVGSVSLTPQSFSDVAVINTASGVTTGTDARSAVVIDLNTDVQDLKKSIKDPRYGSSVTSTSFRGLNMFNYDVRSIATDSGITSVEAYLLVNRTTTTESGGSKMNADAFDSSSAIRGTIVAISLGNSTSKSGLLNLNTTSTTTADAKIINAALFNSASDLNDDIGILFVFNPTTAVSFPAGNSPVVADFFTFGITGDGTTETDRTNNAIYRFELEETGDNTSTFIGSAEFTMLNQLNIFTDSTYTNLRTIDDEVTFIVNDDLDNEDAPRISYFDLGSDGVSTQISVQEDAGSHSGVASFDKDTYKSADTVTVTIEDADLNVDSDVVDIYTAVSAPTSAQSTYTTAAADVAVDTIGSAGLGTYTDGTSFGRLMDITFDDVNWGNKLCTTNTSDDTGLADAGVTLVETGIATGVFTASFQVPNTFCDTATATAAVTTNGKDIAVDYVDFRDVSGNLVEVGDTAGVSANTGSISLDRTVYPVPFGDFGNFATNTAETADGRSVFPVHATGLIDSGTVLETGETLGAGPVNIHVRVNDPDSDASAAGEDKIKTDKAGTTLGPVKVTVTRGSNVVTLAYAGGPAAQPGVIVASGTANQSSVRELGPITEIAPNAGIFQFDLNVEYTDGPSDPKCPVTSVFSIINTTATGTVRSSHFDRAPTDAYCILQGDILTVEYTDPSDSSGDVNTVTDSATFDLRNGVLQSDKSVYIIGSDMILTLIEPDLNLDTENAESYDLDLINWDSDAADISMGDLGGTASNSGSDFDPEPTTLRETGDDTGIYQSVIEIPKSLSNNLLDRGEEIKLEYTDWGPSGADFVGDENEDINLTIYTSNFGATVELDQKVYTWTDKVYITIVAPDHNFDSSLIDDIGNTADDAVKVATRGFKLDQYKLVETGSDTGIFTGEVILTGFASHDADGDGTTGDARGGAATGSGPTGGLLPSDDDDGLTVSFEFTEDETVVGSALIRWNIGEVQFLEASYPATGQGVVRVVDPDMNLNPESVDTFNIDAWSDSDAGGIDLTVTETNEATGIFEGTVFFTVTDESSGHRLRVAEGDTVTAEYTDNTLPNPYTTADELQISATTFIGSIVPPLERAPASNARIVDAFGNELSEVSVDQQIQITADLANGQDRDQSFAYLVQIQDEDGVTVSLSWITGSLAPGQSLNPAQSWTPTSPGTYNVQIFVWASVDNPDALSPPVSTTITVS